MASVLADHSVQSRQINSSPAVRRSVGLYLHIPFCHAKCHFCDFATFVGQESKIDSYLAALEKEMSFYSTRPLLQKSSLPRPGEGQGGGQVGGRFGTPPAPPPSRR